MGLSSLPPCRVIIIGGGASGIATACRLARGFSLDSYCIYDRQGGLGGTWRANIYPGCAVDIPGFCYSYSFALKPDFTQMFPPQAEILQYLLTVSKEYSVEQHFKGGMEWVDADWQEKSYTWVVTLKDIQTKQSFKQECQVLISAVGGLVNPQEISIPGSECFQGTIIHTARWKKDLDLTNKHVAVIGNGASAMQVVPAIINKTKSVTQFMRSPHHIVDATDYNFSARWRDLLRRFPLLFYLIRMILFVYMEITWFRFQNNHLGKLGRESVRRKSRKYVQGMAPESYWNLLIPEYEFGCRRRIFDRGYLATLHKSNMRLTNDPIVEITKNSIITSSGEEIYVDAILLATGFALTHYDVDLKGRNGRTRKQYWDDYGHKATYKSIAMHGFPNFFYVLGPNSGRLYTSTIQMIESEVEMVIHAIRPILTCQASSVEVKYDSQRSYDVRLHKAINKTVHSNSCGGPYSEGSEFLAALASDGTALSPISTIRKLGYALMEMARLRLPALYGTDNSITRDLRVSQAYALLINVGLWSGNGHKMEIAESSAQNLVATLRRAFRYRRSKYSSIVQTTLDVGPELDNEWHHWVEQQSFKRLVYHIFLHVSQAAITPNINRLIPYADLQLPLPGACRLQEAKSATEWKVTVSSALNPPREPEIDLVYEATSIFLYTRLEELQLFAGKEDKNEVRRVYHSAIEWINSIDSQRAILHAGQDIRAAKAIPGTQLRCGVQSQTQIRKSAIYQL
ncbi:Baeyer-Villiger monooxygenase [Talaromyces pinophilus]|nr:Baeyer-Villiger monooxygenase [Talaromyces pinophilus]